MKRIIKYFLIILFLLSGASVGADTLGQNLNFFVSKQYDARARSNITANLAKVSDSAYFYVEDGYWNNLDSGSRSQLLQQINTLASEFDNRIYPTERQFFGSEPNPGIDGDPRLTILLTPLIDGAGGYFDTTNEFSSSQAKESNGREMIYLNISFIGQNKKISAFLAHEFQHLITFNEKDLIRGVKDDIWLNELRSEYAVSLLGYNYDNSGDTSNLERRANSFMQEPSDSLTEWKNQVADYAQVGLFGEYLAEQFSPKVIADTTKNNLIGIHNINASLAQNGFNDSFISVYSNWLVADILNDKKLNSKFGYSADVLKNFRIAPSRGFTNLGGSDSRIVSELFKDWQARWYDFSNFGASGGKIMRIRFSSDSLASFYVAYLIFDSSGGVKINFFVPTQKSDTLYVDKIGESVNRIIIMPIKKDKLSGFESNEVPISLTFAADRIESAPKSAVYGDLMPPVTADVQTQISNIRTLARIADGSLIRAEGDSKVYIIRGNWKRHIRSSKIFSFYKGWGFGKVIVVPPEIADQYKESGLIRYSGGKKVYLIDESGNKHWLNLSPEQFTASGYDWDSIFPANLTELAFYKNSYNIVK